MTAQKTPVTETHWAERDRETMAAFAATLPAVLDTSFTLWQHRVDRIPAQTPHVPHALLFSMRAMEYHRTETPTGCSSAPTGTEYQFLVAADDRRQAMAKVHAQLAAHGFDPLLFSIGSTQQLLILK